MRTLMLISEILLVGISTFCMANSSATFVSIAFLVGIALVILGTVQILVHRFSIIEESDHIANVILTEGITGFIFGIIILSGQISDTNYVIGIFGAWCAIEGAYLLFGISVPESTSASFKNAYFIIGVIAIGWSIYIFFNTLLWNIPQGVIVGFSLFIIAIMRFKALITIKYVKRDAIFSESERLKEAKLDEKHAMEKAKEGIRELKDARRRISRITKEQKRYK